MYIRYNVEDLKKLLIGKIVNWLTITDIFRNPKNNRVTCKCICKCGKECYKDIKYINNNKAVSCGCYHKSEEFSQRFHKIYSENQDIVKQRSEKFKQWCKNNPEKLKLAGEKISYKYKNNPELSDQYRQRMIDLNKTFHVENNRANRADSFKFILENNNYLYKIILQSDIEKLLNGELRSEDKITTKCSICDKFSKHNVRDIINFSESKIKSLRLCKDCLNKFSTSHYENEISEYILTFYDGKYIKNNRGVLNGKELDLYYPDKHIAIEFNGDYWHSEEFKSDTYHYNKLKDCLEKNIILVSMFESEWNSNKDLVKQYLKDLFSNIENKLSFVGNDFINNNYPTPTFTKDQLNYNESYYTFKTSKIYTCGYSIINRE